jgi:hypothetical protein
MCAGAAVMASLSPVRAVFTVALIVVLALKLAEEEEALKAARPEEWAKYSEILGFDIDFSILDFHGFPWCVQTTES